MPSSNVAQVATAKPASTRPGFQWEDPLLLADELSEEERMVQEAARAYCQDKLMPRVRDSFRNEGRVVELAEYEPKMNVTPNAVALKDD